MIIIKRFSQTEPIDISHLSPAAQKEIISRERKKIELDQKISDTSDSLMKSRSRASMSLEDNAKLGAYEMAKNPLTSIGSPMGSYLIGGKIGQVASKGAAMLGASAKLQDVIELGGIGAGRMVTPIITEAAGKAIGTVKGLTAKSAVKRKEKKLKRLIKKREAMGE